MSIKFITDSMCDADPRLEAKYDYDVLPIPITIGSKTYHDGVDIAPYMVVEAGRNDPANFPKTAQVPPLVFKEAFEKHLENGDDVIYIALSSGLSGSCQSAQLIARELKEKYPDRRIEVIDSKSVTVGMALILQQALKLNQLGKSFDDIADTVKFLTEHIQTYFFVGDISWLAKGGRLSKGAAMLGNMLKIVPVLYVSNGVIDVYDKVRGKKRAIRKILETAESLLIERPDQIIAMLAGGNGDIIAKTTKELTKTAKAKHLHVMYPSDGVGAALSVHAGDDFYGLAFFDELPENYVNVIN